MSFEFDVIVVGSCMIDFISYVNRLPRAGETIHSQSFEVGKGGKGANQAIAASRLSCNVAMIGKLGDDPYGLEYKQHFKSEGIYAEHLENVNGSTGVALIVVNTSNGENQIVINSNANECLKEDDIDRAKHILNNSKILICQLETPIHSTLRAMNEFKGISILNAAPAVSNLPESLYKIPTIFCVNEIEAEELTGINFHEIKDARKLVEALLQRGCKTVIVTLGKIGAVLNYEEKIFHIPVPSNIDAKAVVDSTGAGDMFIGALAFFLSRFPQATLMQQVAASIKIASHSTQYRGTQSSYHSFPVIDVMHDHFEFHEL